jgi:hypothetical protein
LRMLQAAKLVKEARRREQIKAAVNKLRSNPDYRITQNKLQNERLKAAKLSAEKAESLMSSINNSRPSEGFFTDKCFIPWPDKILDPADPNFKRLVESEICDIGYAVINITPQGLQFIEDPFVQFAIATNPVKQMYITDKISDPFRRIMDKDPSWIARACPFLTHWTNDVVQGRLCTETTLMRVNQGDTFQRLHMDSDLIRDQIFSENGHGYKRENIVDRYEHIPMEILFALTDDCVTRVCPYSQWIGLMSDEEYERILRIERIPIRLKRGQALIMHPNLVHSGTIPYYRPFDCKLHSKIMAPEMSETSNTERWVPVNWERNATYPLELMLPTRQDVFYRF